MRLVEVRGSYMVIGTYHPLKSVEELAVKDLRVHLGELFQEKPQVDGDRREVPRREAKHPPLEYLVDTVKNSTIPKILASKRLESVYGVKVLSTRSLIVHLLVMPN